MQLKARDIYSISLKDIWDISDTLYEVTYEDNTVIQNTKKDIIFNRYCWETLSMYPNTPITKVCDIKTFLGEGYFNFDTHIKFLEGIFKHTCSVNKLEHYFQKESLLKRVYEVVNLIYNDIVNKVSDCVATIDATDFVNLVNTKDIVDIHSAIKPTPESIENSYRSIKRYMQTTDSTNNFVKAYRSKAINENQANQCIGPRGFVTDLDRTVFKQPIVNGFIRGMGSLYEIMTESRTAAKSLNASDTQIKTSEYASRRIQLLTMSVRNVEPGDCGSTEYFDMFINKDALANMKGKYYLRPDNGQLDYIRGDESHLVNEIVKIRTIFGCKVHNPANVCTVCLGKVAQNFKENSNLGYTMTSYLMEKLTQSILSTKHLTHSVKKSVIKLTGDANKYFYTNEHNNIYFNPDLDLTGIYFILPNNRLSKLVDVLNLPHNNISLTKVGELETIGIKNMKLKTPIIESINISYKDRYSIITKEFLTFIKSIEIESDSRGNFIIDMSKFPKDEPIFHNPLKETNVILFVNKIASMIETTKLKSTDPYEKFITLFNAVTEQLSCNMSIIEVLVYATTTYNSYNADYGLGRLSLHPNSEGKTSLFRHRSLSGLLVYEEQLKELLSQPVEIFDNKQRLSHPMDVLFVPGK